MSTAREGWDFTVPDNDVELLAELRRHGVRPGQRLHVVATPPTPSPDVSEPDRTRRRLGFIGAIDSAPADLSERTDHYLDQGFGRD